MEKRPETPERVLLEMSWKDGHLWFKVDPTLSTEALMMLHTGLDLVKERLHHLLTEADYREDK